jgi:hypothetical protein
MLIIDKKVIDECEFEAERAFLLENSKEAEVVDMNKLRVEWYNARSEMSFTDYCQNSGYQLIKIKQ